ncbi:MAG: A/G-specific adenine glycosylase [Desulfobulbaceae bacterium]|nr:A/G-specific adenine glycosylase [Desulfobulbaceae bacterium]
MIQETEYSLLRDGLLAWFAGNQRDLPWRRTYDPYHVWISEIMLQQTQMERGVEYFNRWMEKFPDVEALCSASEQEVLKAWEGLGYYSRARNLLKAAGKIVAEQGGRIPRDYDNLLSLPGIGPYTAAAVMSIAFNRPYPVVDANVERLFARLEDIDRPVKDRDVRQRMQKLAAVLLAGAAPRDMNQALMELGALVCTPKNPDCPHCPIQIHCLAFRAGTVADRPVPGSRQGKIDIDMACTIINVENKIFIQQRRYDDVWGGLWEFPGGRLKDGESPAAAAVRELHEETGFQAEKPEPFHTVTHFYTRYRVTLHSFVTGIRRGTNIEPKLTAALQYRWVTRQELDQYPFPAGHRRLVEKLQSAEAGPGERR